LYVLYNIFTKFLGAISYNYTHTNFVYIPTNTAFAPNRPSKLLLHQRTTRNSFRPNSPYSQYTTANAFRQ